MTRSVQPTPSEAVAEQAADWYVRLQADTADGADWLAFEAWLAAAPAHADAYDRLEQAYLALDGHGESGIEAEAPTGSVVSLSARRPRSPARGWFVGVGLAAAACLAVAALGLTFRPEPAPVPQVYETGTGQSRTVALEDGTRIHLNTATRLSVSFAARGRRVVMSGGEAAFDVAHDPARPFVIALGAREVRVVGTEFDIQRLGPRTTVTVRRGVVEVGPTGGPPAARLIKGQQLSQADDEAAPRVGAVDPEESFAWRAGRVIYHDRSLAEVVADLSRYFETPILLSDPSLGRIRVSGVLLIDSEDAVVRRLQGFLPIRSERSAAGVVLYPAKP